MRWMLRIIGVGLCQCALAVQAQVPIDYPDEYGNVVAAARREGRVVVFSAADLASVSPLIKDFQALYKDIEVDYRDMNTVDLYARAVSQRADGGTPADIVWSSSMDLQIKLVNDGYALAYKSPEIAKLPAWAVWRNEAFGTTYEPVVFVYNQRLLKPDEVPQSHAGVPSFLQFNAERLKGKLTAYDIEKSGVGFLLITQDSQSNPLFWEMAKAFGSVGASYQSSSQAMMERISSGESLFGYNILGSYALLRAKTDSNLGVVTPRDYTLILSRIMFIAKTARNPNAAKLWLDYVLSKRGQTIIAKQAELGAIRDDVEGALTISGLGNSLGGALKPITVGAGLLTFLDQAKRRDFVKQWRQTVVPGK